MDIGIPEELRDLKIVIIDSIYDNLNDFFALEFFKKIIRFKIRGYQKEYPLGVLPVDATDFVCTHLVICKEFTTDLVPVVAYKSVTYDSCKRSHLGFPPANIKGAAPEHQQAVQNYISLAENERKSLRYCSSYTIAPEFRRNKELAQELRNILCALHASFHSYYQTGILITCGAVKFKTEKLFQSWGYEPITHNGSVLPNFLQTSIFDGEAQMQVLSEFTPHAKLQMKRYGHLWEKRITIGNQINVPSVDEKLRVA